MTAAEARGLLSTYLTTTRRVTAPQLKEARAILDADHELARRLQLAVGEDDAAWYHCLVFEGRVAEFAELSAMERRDEFPLLAAHVEECPACRNRLISIRAIWTPLDPLRDAGKRLTESLVVVAGAVGAIFDRGFGLPSEELTFSAATAGPGSPAELHREWRLMDEETGFAVRIIVDRENEMLKLHFIMERAEIASPMRLELRPAHGVGLLYAGDLPGARSPALRVPAGEWRLIFIYRGERRFEVPIIWSTETI